MRLAFSPCPNDTFVFHAWTHGLIDGAPPSEVTYADIDVTNTAAERGEFDVVKVSYAALPWLLDRYTLLPCGGALGRGCGPLVLTGGDLTDGSRRPDGRGPERAVDRVPAVPAVGGRAASPARIDVVPFAAIMPAVRDGRYDAGLVIHEARFTYPDYGLTALVDLGEWWEADTGLPIPLGAILARRGAGRSCAGRRRCGRRSSTPGRTRRRPPTTSPSTPPRCRPTCRHQHIELYVNEFTRDLGERGLRRRPKPCSTARTRPASRPVVPGAALIQASHKPPGRQASRLSANARSSRATLRASPCSG